jgi:hypothetical protein
MHAQEKGSSNFIGINPSVTIEPFYEKGELDINVCPFVFQKTITRRIDFRLMTVVNYGFRNTGNTFTHIGLQPALPIFLKAKEDNRMPSKGLFIAPGFGVTRNLIEKHSNAGLWLEPGYMLSISPKWSISFGAQFGATHFWYDSGESKWGSHFGIKVIFGFNFTKV